jgi:hypothetical protein
MRCYFCQQHIDLKNIHKMEGYPPLQIGDCQDCIRKQITTTTVVDNDQIVTAHIYVNYEKDKYHLLFNIKGNYFIIIHWPIKIEAFNLNDQKKIFELNCIPTITIDNAINKLETILTFL